jgi:hypothetical protein
VNGVDAGTLVKVLGAPAGAVLTVLYLRRWHRRRRREVRELVAEGHADWAAACRVIKGAELLADAVPTARADQASGTLLATGERLEWRPDTWSLDAGWTPGSRSLAGARLLSSSWRRDIVGLKARMVHLEVPGGEVMLGITSESGHPPPQLGTEPTRRPD